MSIHNVSLACWAFHSQLCERGRYASHITLPLVWFLWVGFGSHQWLLVLVEVGTWVAAVHGSTHQEVHRAEDQIPAG